MGKEVTLRILFCLESFQMMANGERKFLLFFPSVNYRRIFSIHLKNSRFVEDVLFYPENGVMAFPKIEIKWDWVSDLHVYVKSDAVIWFWQCCHVRTRQTSENQITDRTCVVQTNSRVKWSWFNSEMSEFNCLAVVLSALLFHTFYPIRPNFRKWFVSQNIEPLSLRSTSWGVMMNMFAIRYFFPSTGNWRINLWNW